MKKNDIFVFLLTAVFFSCNTGKENASFPNNQIPNVQIAGALKNVMSEGKIQGIIYLDSIENKEGLYGLGPAENLKGELLILDGRSYLSTIDQDSTLKVQETFDLKAPFFVYANESRWKATKVPDSVTTIRELESLLDQKMELTKEPFVFKLSGIVEEAKIHVQNLPEGIQVSSPSDAHQGQQNFELQNEEVSIVGFFSREHEGVFTHKNSYLHMHLITKDKTKMGHLDNVKFKAMKLFLPHNGQEASISEEL